MKISTSLFQILLLLTFSNSATFAQSTNGLKGAYIVNSETKVPIPDASVQSQNETFNALSDENGFVSFKSLPISISRLVISHIGFRTDTIEIAALTSLNNTSVINLQAKVSRLQEVQVKATTNGGIFKTISDLDIHLRPINNSQEVLRMVPSLFI